MITLGGLISRRRLSTFSTLFPQYHLCVLCFVLNQRPRSCLTTPRNTQCMVSIAIPFTISKLGSCNKGLGALKPQTYKTDFKVNITCTCTCISPPPKNNLLLQPLCHCKCASVHLVSIPNSAMRDHSAPNNNKNYIGAH